MAAEDLFEVRAEESRERLTTLRSDLERRITAIEHRFDDPSVCIYATGSLAREEATTHSDLDAFFILSGRKVEKQLGRIRDVTILNAVVEAAEAAGFPDFSNEGGFSVFST